MDYNIQNTLKKKVAGFYIRTTNKNGQSINDQSEFWEGFFTKGMNDKINNKNNPSEILGVYFNSHFSNITDLILRLNSFRENSLFSILYMPLN